MHSSRDLKERMTPTSAEVLEDQKPQLKTPESIEKRALESTNVESPLLLSISRSSASLLFVVPFFNTVCSTLLFCRSPLLLCFRMLYFSNFYFVFNVSAISLVYTFFDAQSLLFCFLKASTSVLSGVFNFFYLYTLPVLLRLLESYALSSPYLNAFASPLLVSFLKSLHLFFLESFTSAVFSVICCSAFCNP